MKIVVVSGKGGTGKTTVASSFSELWTANVVKIDCDVDAANMHLMFPSKIHEKYSFKGAKVARIDAAKCTACHNCIKVCRFGAIQVKEKPYVDELKCEGCGACRWVCPSSAMTLDEEVTGEVILSEMQNGFLSRAEMVAGAEGSGKLVSEVRRQGDGVVSHQLLDGSPGTGCSVIASITGTDIAVVVTEPTFSGLHDMKRVLALIEHFEAEPLVIINKFDINQEMTQRIERYCNEKNIEMIGKIPFDVLVKTSINTGTPIVHYQDSMAGKAIRKCINKLKERINI